MTEYPTPGGWFVFSQSGEYFAFKDKCAADVLAKRRDKLWPEHAPHLVVQLVDVAIVAELLEALRLFAVYGRPGSRDVEVGAAIAALAKFEGVGPMTTKEGVPHLTYPLPFDCSRCEPPEPADQCTRCRRWSDMPGQTWGPLTPMMGATPNGNDCQFLEKPE